MESQVVQQIEAIEREVQATPKSNNGRKQFTNGFVRRAVALYKRTEYTQKDFCTLIGVNQGTFSKWACDNGARQRNQNKLQRRSSVNASTKEVVRRVHEIIDSIAEHKAAINVLDTELGDLLS